MAVVRIRFWQNQGSPWICPIEFFCNGIEAGIIRKYTRSHTSPLLKPYPAPYLLLPGTSYQWLPPFLFFRSSRYGYPAVCVLLPQCSECYAPLCPCPNDAPPKYICHIKAIINLWRKATSYANFETTAVGLIVL